MQLAEAQPLSKTVTGGGQSGAPEWIHIMPMGAFQGKDGRGPYFLRDPFAVITNTKAYHGATDIPVDYDHQLLWVRQNGRPAIAAGWIKRLEAREDGIWGLVEWTQAAETRIAAKEYRYVSPYFGYIPGGDVTKIESVALVNNPNLELTAVASVGLDAAQFNPQSLTKEETTVCSALGLRPVEFMRTKTTGDYAKAAHAASAGLTQEEKRVCAQLGISEYNFLQTRKNRV